MTVGLPLVKQLRLWHWLAGENKVAVAEVLPRSSMRHISAAHAGKL